VKLWGRGRSDETPDQAAILNEPRDSEAAALWAARYDEVPLAGLSTAEILSRTYLRLMDGNSFPAEAQHLFSYARPVGGNLVEVLAFESPDSVAVLRDKDVAEIGLDQLRAAGLENLSDCQLNDYDIVDLPNGGRLHVLSGESVFSASKILVLPEVLRQVLGPREYPNGVLVAAPFRHQFGFSPVEGPEALTTATVMAEVTLVGFVDGIVPLSPNVYWWKDGELLQISAVDEDGTVELAEDGPFIELIAQLAG
jgi:hypothetical protein